MNGEQANLRFGIFDWIDENPQLSLAEIYEQRLQMLEYADQAGFWCYHLAEHHGTPLGMAPSPNLFLAAAAQRTRRLRLGPLVQLLPLYNPVRNIEEVCSLDHLSNGRLELGVGRGVSPSELAIYNVRSEESRERFAECLDILLMGLSTGRVSYEGRYYTMKDVEIPVRPFQTPYPPLWYPTASAERVPYIAGEGFNTILGLTTDTLADTVAAVSLYRAVMAQSTARADRLNAHVTDPCYGIQRHVYVGETDSEAATVARTAYDAFDLNFRTRPGVQPGEQRSRRGDFDTALRRGLIIAGSPETVRTLVQDAVQSTGANYFVGTFSFGSLSTQQTLSSLRLFAEEVMPRVKAAPETSQK